MKIDRRVEKNYCTCLGGVYNEGVHRETGQRALGRQHIIMTKLQCVSDRFDRDGGIYDDLADFQAMCESCFGESPTLNQDIDGQVYVDGELVLVPVEVAS